MNLSQKLAKRSPLLQQYNKYYGSFHHLELSGKVSNRMNFNGKEHIIWCLNDYLGLMHHPESIKEAADVTQEFGPSYPHSVRLSVGHTEAHIQLEKTLSEFTHKEDAMLVNLGYQGFFSTIDALTNRHDTIIYDQKCHACLIDGVRIHNGGKFAFKHNDVEHLEVQINRALKTHNPDLGTIMVVVDGLYSMHGELAPLDKIVQLKKKYNFTLFVDDSHAFGVFGEKGIGSPEHFGVENDVDVYVSTFTKAFGNLGGFIAGKKDIIDYLRYAVRSQIFSRTLPLSMVRSVSKNFEIFTREPERRERLWNSTLKFQNGLRKLDIFFGKSEGPIIPIHINGSIENGLEILSCMREKGIFTYLVAYPVVPLGSNLIRMVCTYNLTDEDIDYTLKVFKYLKQKYPKQLSKPQKNTI